MKVSKPRQGRIRKPAKSGKNTLYRQNDTRGPKKPAKFFDAVGKTVKKAVSNVKTKIEEKKASKSKPTPVKGKKARASF